MNHDQHLIERIVEDVFRERMKYLLPIILRNPSSL
jgi:hypothetical protein